MDVWCTVCANFILQSFFLLIGVVWLAHAGWLWWTHGNDDCFCSPHSTPWFTWWLLNTKNIMKKMYQQHDHEPLYTSLLMSVGGGRGNSRNFSGPQVASEYWLRSRYYPKKLDIMSVTSLRDEAGSLFLSPALSLCPSSKAVPPQVRMLTAETQTEKHPSDFDFNFFMTRWEIDLIIQDQLTRKKKIILWFIIASFWLKHTEYRSCAY